MAGLAAKLGSLGYHVNLPVLPGHASVPEDLLKVSHEDWLKTVEQAFIETRAATKKQIAIGLSMGATLALHLAANFSFAGVVALAPALKLPWWQEAGIHVLAPIIKTRRKPHGPDVNDDYGKQVLNSYPEYPLAAALEVFHLQRRVRAELDRITMPLLVIHSRHDHTIPLHNVGYLLARVRSTHAEKMIVEKSFHVLTVDYDREAIFARIAHFIQQVT